MSFQCPGEPYVISHAVHLGRLARFYPACRQCPHRNDSESLSPQLIKRLAVSWETSAASDLAVNPDVTANTGRNAITGPSANRGPWCHEGMAGVVGNQLGTREARQAAVAFGSDLRARADFETLPTIVMASDGRAATADLVAAVSDGLRYAACQVIDIGAATAQGVVHELQGRKAQGGVLIGNGPSLPQTASLRFWGGDTIPYSTDGQLESIKAGYLDPPRRSARQNGGLRREQRDVEAHLARLAPSFHGLRPLHVVWSTTCMPLRNCVQRLIATSACTFHNAESTSASETGDELVREPARGRTPFPSRRYTIAGSGLSPPTSATESRGPWSWHGASTKAVDQIRRHMVGASHFGIWIDGDGEICRVVDERALPVKACELLTLVARDTLMKHPGAVIALESGCPPSVIQSIATYGGSIVEGGTTREQMARTIVRSGAILGGGPSGLIWFNDGAPSPDALKTLTRLLVILSQSDRPLSEVIQDLT